MKIPEKVQAVLNNKKKLIPIIAITLVIVTAIVFFIVKAVNDKRARDKVAEYLNQHLETYGELNIISDSFIVDDKRNTIAGIKETCRAGADTVTLDLCFNTDDVPVICENYDNITKNSLKLVDVFKLMNEEKYKELKINLRLRQLGSLVKFNELLSEYDVSGRVIISGLDENRYSLISGDSTSAGIFFDYKPAETAKESLEEIMALQKKYGITGVIIPYSDVTVELSDLLNERGVVFIAENADEELDMYSAIDSGAANIETAYPEKLKDVYSQWEEKTKDDINKEIINELK